MRNAHRVNGSSVRGNGGKSAANRYHQRRIKSGTRQGAQALKRQALRKSQEEREGFHIAHESGAEIFVTVGALLLVADRVQALTKVDLEQALVTATNSMFIYALDLYHEQLRFYELSQAELVMEELPGAGHDLPNSLHFAYDHDDGNTIFIDVEKWFAYN